MIAESSDRAWFRARLRDLQAAYDSDWEGVSPKRADIRGRKIGLVEGRIMEFCFQNAIEPRDVADYGRKLKIISWTPPILATEDAERPTPSSDFEGCLLTRKEK